MKLPFENFSMELSSIALAALSSMALAAIVGIFLHAVLPGKESGGDTAAILGDE